MKMTAEHMLDNMATASQNRSILEDRVTRGAILRTVNQFLAINWACTSDNLSEELEKHPDFNG